MKKIQLPCYKATQRQRSYHTFLPKGKVCNKVLSSAILAYNFKCCGLDGRKTC